MEKLKIYVSTHKVFKPIYQSPLYEIVAQPQVNVDDLMNETKLVVHHMSEDHLFYKMPRGFSDIANIHWVWKHLPETEYIGFAQFGAELTLPDPLSVEWVEKILSEHSVICLSIPLDMTIREQYGRWHNSRDYDALIKALNATHPEESGRFLEYSNQSTFHNGDMFIMRYSDFDRLMHFLEDVMMPLINKYGFGNDDDIYRLFRRRFWMHRKIYNSRMPAYLSERLISYFLYKMENKYIVPIHDFETTDL